MVAAAQDVLYVVKYGPGGRRNHADNLRENGQLALAACVEQALGGQLLLEPLQLQGQLAEALGRNHVNHDVEGAAGFVEGDAPVGRYRIAVFQQVDAPLAAKHDRLEHGLAVFEIEVGVTEEAMLRLETSPSIHRSARNWLDSSSSLM